MASRASVTPWIVVLAGMILVVAAALAVIVWSGKLQAGGVRAPVALPSGGSTPRPQPMPSPLPKPAG